MGATNQCASPGNRTLYIQHMRQPLYLWDLASYNTWYITLRVHHTQSTSHSEFITLWVHHTQGSSHSEFITLRVHHTQGSSHSGFITLIHIVYIFFSLWTCFPCACQVSNSCILTSQACNCSSCFSGTTG